VIRAALAAAASRLASASDTPRLDAELLMAHALGVERGALLLGGLDGAEPASFAPLVERRLRSEPIAYIVGRRAFWTIELEVGPGALVPRADSELLIEAAVDHFGATGPRTVLDLGTGPGTLLLAALDQWPSASGIGVDASSQALDYARRNATRLGMSDRARFVLGGWYSCDAPADLLLCNPPYIEEGTVLAADVAGFEPHGALFSGADGLDDYRAIVPLLPRLVAPGGLACIEIGAGQAAVVSALLAEQGFDAVLRHDLGGRARCFVVRG
jgi:release factor glutamine methyltransferase